MIKLQNLSFFGGIFLNKMLAYMKTISWVSLIKIVCGIPYSILAEMILDEFLLNSESLWVDSVSGINILS